MGQKERGATDDDGDRARNPNPTAPGSLGHGDEPLRDHVAIIGNGRAYAHIRTTCALALIGLVGFWIDTAVRHDDGAGAHPMRTRILVIMAALIAATIYFRLWPGA